MAINTWLVKTLSMYSMSVDSQWISYFEGQMK